MAYTLKNLKDVKDSAPEYDLGDFHEARFAGDDLGAHDTGVSHHFVKPGKRQPFAHKHDEAEEIYVVLNGSGKIKLGEKIENVKALDAVRISPKTARQVEAGPDGLEFIAFGPHHKGDGELIEEGIWD